MFNLKLRISIVRGLKTGAALKGLPPVLNQIKSLRR